MPVHRPLGIDLASDYYPTVNNPHAQILLYGLSLFLSAFQPPDHSLQHWRPLFWPWNAFKPLIRAKKYLFALYTNSVVKAGSIKMYKQSKMLMAWPRGVGMLKIISSGRVKCDRSPPQIMISFFYWDFKMLWIEESGVSSPLSLNKISVNTIYFHIEKIITSGMQLNQKFRATPAATYSIKVTYYTCLFSLPFARGAASQQRV